MYLFHGTPASGFLLSPLCIALVKHSPLPFFYFHAPPFFLSLLLVPCSFVIPVSVFVPCPFPMLVELFRRRARNDDASQTASRRAERFERRTERSNERIRLHVLNERFVGRWRKIRQRCRGGEISRRSAQPDATKRGIVLLDSV